MTANPSRRAFTLTELILLLAVLAVIGFLLLPVLLRAREEARSNTCVRNLKQLGLVMQDYLVKRQVYPPACTVEKEAATGWILDVGFRPKSRVGWSWIVQVLPQLEQTELYDTLRMRESGPLWEPPGEGTPHKDVMNATFEYLICPAFRGNRWRDPEAKTEAITNYKAMGATHLESLRLATPQYEHANPGYGGVQSRRIHPDGAIFPGARVDEKDFGAGALSHTIFLCESVEQNAARWTVGMETVLVGLPPEVDYDLYEDYYAPHGFDGDFGERSGVRKAHPDWATYVGYDYRNKRYHDYTGGKLQAIFGPSSHHPGYVNHVFGDNSAHKISEDIDVALYMFLITRNGRDPAGGFFH